LIPIQESRSLVELEKKFFSGILSNMKDFLVTIRKNKHFTKILLGALLLIVLLILVVNKTKGTEQAKYQVTKRTVSDSIELAGTINVDRRVDLGFATSGRVIQVLVEEGEKVRKGQAIARVDQNGLSAQLIQARANEVVTWVDTDSSTTGAGDNLATEKIRQETLVHGTHQEYLSGDLQAYPIDELTRSITPPVISGTYVGTQEGEYKIEIYKSNSESGYSYNLSGLESGRGSAYSKQSGSFGTKGLFIRFTEGTNYQDTTWIIPVPNTRSSSFVSRKSAYENARTLRDQILKSTENEYRRLTGGTDVSRSEALKNQARAQVQAVYAELANGTVVAPFDGIVARNYLEVGQIASGYQPYITLVGDMRMQLELNVPEIYINKIAEGDEVYVTLDAFPDEPFAGIVEKIDIIDTIIDGVPVYQTLVRLIEPSDSIRIGMNAKARILSEEIKNVLAVPKHYLTNIEKDNTKVLLFDESDGQPKEVPVVIGFEGNDGYVVILSGISEGDTLVRPEL